MTPTEIPAASLLDLIAALRARALSPVELVEHTLARIERTHAQINAVVALRDREQVMAEARQAEARIGRGEGRPLEGVPLGVKDLEDVAGMVTSCGSKLYADHVAARDEVHVERLRAAGAIVVGKTNTPEFGLSSITKNLLFGDSRNPWNVQRSPGGSSGGSAAALVGGVLPLVTASDGGGSIRIPASFSGAYGFKPSFGRVPMGPSPAFSTTLRACYGPLTKTVEDAAFVLDQYAGPSPHDPTSLPAVEHRYLDRVRKGAPDGLRLGLSLDMGGMPVESEVKAAVEEGARVLQGLGHTLVPIAGGPPQAGDSWLQTAGFAVAASHGERARGRESELAKWVAELMREGATMSPGAWEQSQRMRAEIRDFCTHVFEQCDLLISPTTPYTAPPARGPFPSEIDGTPCSAGASGQFCMPFNYNWNPAASVRVGMSKAGLPIGMQLAGPMHRDALVLQVSRAFERERPWHPDWPVC
ncbi:MAG: amidase [Myxococcales bacterium]|nr:amidase [Myxococcales bacterium]